jgi:hypothetical protein
MPGANECSPTDVVGQATDAVMTIADQHMLYRHPWTESGASGGSDQSAAGRSSLTSWPPSTEIAVGQCNQQQLIARVDQKTSAEQGLVLIRHLMVAHPRSKSALERCRCSVGRTVVRPARWLAFCQAPRLVNVRLLPSHRCRCVFEFVYEGDKPLHVGENRKWWLVQNTAHRTLKIHRRFRVDEGQRI